VAHVAIRNRVATDARRTHGGTEFHILDVLKLVFPEDIVPPTVIHPLAKQFNGWLSSVFFLFRHVKIINKDDAFCSRLGSKVAFSASAHAAVNDRLRLVRRGLCRKRKCDVVVLFVLEVVL